MRSTERRHPTLCLRRVGRSLDLLDSYFISSLRLSRKRQPRRSLPEKCGALKVCSGRNGADSMCSAAAQQRAASEKSSRREEQPLRSHRTRSTSICNMGKSDDSPVRWKSYSHRSGAQCRFLIANTSSFQTLDWRRGCL